VTKAAEQVPRKSAVIRPSIAFRVCFVVFMCVWCGFTLTALIAAALSGSPATVVPFLMLAFGLTFGYRMVRMSVTLDPQALTVRNIYRTRRIAQGDIQGFRHGPMSENPFTRTIYVMLRDGTVLPLDVAGRAYFFGRGQAVLDDRMRTFQTWLDEH
jgi:hypothetical protein